MRAIILTRSGGVKKFVVLGGKGFSSVIYDTIEDADGKQKRVLNKKETTLAQQKQQAIKDAFRDWIWRDPHRRETLSTKYNELFNSTDLVSMMALISVSAA